MEDPTIFGVGTNWSCSFRVFLADLTPNTTKWLRLHRGGAGWIDYTNGFPQYFDGSILSSVAGGYKIQYRDGSTETFTTALVPVSGITNYFLTSAGDPTGNGPSYSYTTDGGVFRLDAVTGPDGYATQLAYTNSTYPNQITGVTDPYSRAISLVYDTAGYLSNIVDVVGLSTYFQYDVGSRRSWVTNMVTPYGATAFRYGGVDADAGNFYSGGNLVNRFVEVTLPTGGKHLFLYRHDCSGFMSSQYGSVPSTSPLANTFDNVDQYNRNSFHWSPLQYPDLSSAYQSSGDVTQLTTGDYTLGRLYHWLLDPSTGYTADTLSLERAASQDGTTTGQITWYDYDGKTSGNNYIGTNAMPSFEALILPDSTTRYTHSARNKYGLVTQDISTYTTTAGSVGRRTNSFLYASNTIDLLQQVGPNNEQVVSNYFATGNTIHLPNASYDALNQATLYSYNTYGQVTSVASPAGLTTTNSYFGSGSSLNRLATTIDLEISRTNTFTYSNGLVNSHTDERGLTSTNYWDALQRLTGVTYPNGSISNIYTYLDLTASKDRLNNWTHFGYNSMRQKIAETNANGVVTAYGYCDCGALMSLTNAWNTPVQQVTSYAYDYQGNLTYEFRPDVTLTNWYNSLGQASQAGDGWTTRALGYDNRGALTVVSNAFGLEKRTVFDIEGRPLWVTDANGVTTTNSYDSLGRLGSRLYPDGGLEQFGYSAKGLVIYTNQLELLTQYGYDPAGRKTVETNANNEVIRYTNSAAGDLLSLTDGKGQTTAWTYDPYGRVTNKLDQAGTVVLKYAYDPGNRLTNRWSAAKGNTGYAYDPVGNLTNIAYAVNPVQFQYDWLNRLTNMVDAVGTTIYTYTIGGQLLTEDGPFASDTVTNVYQNRKRAALALQQQTGTWTNGFGWDAAGRLTNVVSPAGSFSYSYNAPRYLLPALRTLPNGATITNTYDSVARLLSTVLNNSSHTALDSPTYGYNHGSQRTAYTNAAGTYVQYTYDNIGQLTVDNSSVATEDRGYYYDAAWNLNRLTNNGSVSSLTVDSKNQLATAYGATCVYDGNGGLTNFNSYHSYSYDDENRLISAYDGTYHSYRSDFVYDGLGRLRKRIEYYWNTNGFAPRGIVPNSGGAFWDVNYLVLYIYDGKRVIQERDSTDTPTVSYTRGNDLGGSLEGAGGIGGLLARSDGYSSGSWTDHNDYFADGNGNITSLINSSQSIVASYRYDPFGNTISKSGSFADANVYRFSSKEINVDTGMYYYLYRFYAPNLQRWISTDPLADPGFRVVRHLRQPPGFHEENAYQFVANDGVNNSDSYGLVACKLRPTNCDKDRTDCIIRGGIICGAGCALMGEGPWCLLPCAVAYGTACAKQYDDCIHGK